MLRTQYFRSVICLLLSFSFFNVSLANTRVVGADYASQGLIGTMDIVEGLDRESAQNEIQEILDRGEIQELLMQHGLNQKEVSQRIASLSDAELLALKSDVQEAKAGGILTTILVVVLIIYLVQRI